MNQSIKNRIKKLEENAGGSNVGIVIIGWDEWPAFHALSDAELERLYPHDGPGVRLFLPGVCPSAEAWEAMGVCYAETTGLRGSILPSNRQTGGKPTRNPSK